MPKDTKKKPTPKTSETPPEETDTVSQETTPEVNTVAIKKESVKTKTDITLAKAQPGSLVATLGSSSSVFREAYLNKLTKLDAKVPTETDTQKAIDKLPEDLQDNVYSFMSRMTGDKEGLMEDDNTPDLTELRLYHGTGNDPTRPTEMIPGHFYLTTGENLKKDFIGTPLAMWFGSTMWPASDDGESRGAPICQTMDRKMGSSFGLCVQCPNQPWKNGEQQKCTNDVLVLMLRKELKDVVLVRFSKSSEGAGRKLRKLLKHSDHLWSRWFIISSEGQTGKTNKTHKWFINKINPVEGDAGYTDKTIHDFCRIMSISLQQTVMWPGIARVYAQAEDSLKDAGGTGESGSENVVGPTDEDEDEDDGKDPGYGEMDNMSDAPSV